MALNKNDLLSLVATNIPDNTSGDISPASVRQVLEQMVSSDANLEDLTEQFLLGLLNVKALQFDISKPNPPYREGQAFYDNQSMSLSYYNAVSDTTINVGQEVVIAVYNDTGAAIPNGYSTRYSGSSVGGFPSVALSLADTVENASCVGVATHEIPDGTVGFITTIGSIGGLNTSAYSTGDALYVDPVTPGALTNIIPSIVSLVAVVTVSDASEGKMFSTITEVQDPKAFSQNSQGVANVLPINTTPIPMEGYTQTPFSRNMNVQTPTGGQGDPRCIVSPETNAFSGFYDISFGVSFTASSNAVVYAEIYINGIASGVRAIADVSNGQIDDGSITLPRALTQQAIAPSDEIEIYVYTSSGSTNLTIQALLINATRVGNI